MKQASIQPGTSNPAQQLELLTAKAQAADKLSDAAEKKARLAKAKFKAARKVFKQAKKSAKKTAKQAKRARKELAALRSRLADQRKKKSTKSVVKKRSRSKVLLPSVEAVEVPVAPMESAPAVTVPGDSESVPVAAPETPTVAP